MRESSSDSARHAVDSCRRKPLRRKKVTSLLLTRELTSPFVTHPNPCFSGWGGKSRTKHDNFLPSRIVGRSDVIFREGACRWKKLDPVGAIPRPSVSLR